MLHIATLCSFPFQEMRDRVRIDVEREKGIDELWKVLGVILLGKRKIRLLPKV